VPCKDSRTPSNRGLDISTEKSRAIKLAVDGVGRGHAESATSPDAASPRRIGGRGGGGFFSRSRSPPRDRLQRALTCSTSTEQIVAQARFLLAAAGSPPLRDGADEAPLYVLMPFGYDGAGNNVRAYPSRRVSGACRRFRVANRLPRLPQLPPAPARLRRHPGGAGRRHWRRARPTPGGTVLLSPRPRPGRARLASLPSPGAARGFANKPSQLGVAATIERREGRLTIAPAGASENQAPAAPRRAHRPAGPPRSHRARPPCCRRVADAQLDRRFLYGASERRRFLDRLVTAPAPYIPATSRLLNALRQRARLPGRGNRTLTGSPFSKTLWPRQRACALAAARAGHRPPPRWPPRVGRRPRSRALHWPWPAFDAGSPRMAALDPKDRLRASLAAPACATPDAAPHPAAAFADLSVAISTSICRPPRARGPHKARLVSIALAHARWWR